jgi:carbamoyl-phosphate synthase large subunit
LLSTGPIDSKAELFESTKILKNMGFELYATKGTAEFMKNNGIDSKVLYWPSEGKEPNTMSYISDGKIDMVINIPKNIEKEELDNDYLIRRQAVDFNVPLITDLQVAKRLVEAMQKTSLEDLKIKSLDEYE